MQAALYVTICLWSQQHPELTCHEVIAPGKYASVDACISGNSDAVMKWLDEVGPTFTATPGDHFRLLSVRCGLDGTAE
jgi:hypothetical protein